MQERATDLQLLDQVVDRIPSDPNLVVFTHQGTGQDGRTMARGKDRGVRRDGLEMPRHHARVEMDQKSVVRERRREELLSRQPRSVGVYPEP